MRRMHQRAAGFMLALIFCTSGILVVSDQNVLAQVTTAITSSGLNTHVSPPTPLPSGQITHDITGGTRPGNGPNLFHSFGKFSVGENNIANFLNDSSLPTSNILGRVTGGNVSNIFGTIQTTGFGSANLFLMNPAGFLFGPNATLNVGGMVTFTSADYFRLTDGARFKAVPNAAADALLSAAPVAAFGFLGSHPGAITVQGSQFMVAPGTGLSLVGGNITIQSGTLQDGTVQPARLSAHGQLSMPAGQINLVSVASKGEVVRTSTPQGGADLDVSSFSHLGNVTINGGGTDAGLTLIRGGQLVMNNAYIGLPGPNDPGLPIDTRAVDIAVRGDALLQGSSINTRLGDTTITAKNLTLNSTRIYADASNSITQNLQGTSVFLNASNNLTIDSASSVGISYIVNYVSGANISLSGGRIVMDGSLYTTGDARPSGSVSLDATRSIDVTGTISTRVGDVLFTKSGDVNIHAPIVRVTGGTINAAGGPLGAGDVTITGTNVSLTNGTKIDANTGPSGDAGHITIRAGKVLVDHSSLSVSNNIDTGPGTISIDANQSLIIQNGSTLSANNSALIPGPTGIQAGTIHLESGHKIIVQDSTVSANSVGAHGGTIELKSPGVVRIKDSVISASTTGDTAAAHGGTIEIATPRKVVIKGSELQTNAAAGPGGTIKITATQRVVEDAASVISATSATGPDGSVTITAPMTILNGVVEP